MSGVTVRANLHFHRGRRTGKQIRAGEEPKSVPTGRIPRVSKLMALAIRFDQLIRDGVVADQAALARLGHVTRARMSQIMALLNLAPDIQEAILSLPPVEKGKDPITERNVRVIAALPDWKKQRQRWTPYKASRCPS